MGLTRHGHTHLLRPHRRPFHSIHILSWQRVDAPSTRTDKDQLSASHLCLTDCLPLRPASHCHAHAQSEAGHHTTPPSQTAIITRLPESSCPASHSSNSLPPAPAPRTVSFSPPLLRSHHRAPPREGTKEEERGHRRRGFGLRSRRFATREGADRARALGPRGGSGRRVPFLFSPLRSAPGGCGVWCSC